MAVEVVEGDALVLALGPDKEPIAETSTSTLSKSLGGGTMARIAACRYAATWSTSAGSSMVRR
jgi:hypothetical protein